MQKCPNCQKNNALVHPLYGVTTCKPCNDRRQTQQSPGGDIEFTSESIKQQRVDYGDDVVQPFRSGQLSKRYVEKYGTEHIQVSEKEVKEAMDKPDVWSGDIGYYRE